MTAKAATTPGIAEAPPHEEWRPVCGWPYEVSSHGHVRRIGNERILAPSLHTNGYRRVNLYNSGEKKDAFIHRLVCEAFHGTAPESEPEVDHINHIRTDNRAANLRWSSIAANRARRLHRRGDAHPNAKLNARTVIAIRSLPFRRGQDAVLAKHLGVTRETIRDIRLGKCWRHVNA